MLRFRPSPPNSSSSTESSAAEPQNVRGSSAPRAKNWSRAAQAVFGISSNTPTILNVLAQEFGRCCSNAALPVLSAPAHGAATVVTNNQALDTPDASGFGTNDFFAFEIAQGGFASTNTITVMLNPPVAGSVSNNLHTLDAVSIPALPADLSPKGSPLTIVSAGGATSRTVSVNSDQSIEHTPFSDATKTVDSIIYTVTDPRGQAKSVGG